MPSLALTEDWQEVTGRLSMSPGETWAVEFHGPPSAVVHALDVEGSARPADDADGFFVHFNRDRNPQVQPVLTLTPRAGWTWWLRARGTATLVAAEAA